MSAPADLAAVVREALELMHDAEALAALDALLSLVEEAEQKYQATLTLEGEAKLRRQLEEMRRERDDLLTERKELWDRRDELERLRAAAVSEYLAAEREVERLLRGLLAAGVAVDWIGNEHPRVLREMPTEIYRGLTIARAALETSGRDPFSGEPGTATSAGGSWGNSASGKAKP